MIVLSLFDGKSCGYEALQMAGIEIEKYYASEIDKYAEAVSRYNHPDIIRLGDVTNWKKWDISWKDIDLCIAGSPCTSFSMAGSGKGFEGESGLYWHFSDILKHVLSHNPDACFMLENVMMKKEWRDIITNDLGVEPTQINSSLLTAQNRKRFYWNNIDDIEQPEDQHIYLKDIILDGIVDRNKSHCVTASVGRTTSREYWKKNQGGLVLNQDVIDTIFSFTPTRTEEAKQMRKESMKKGRDHTPFFKKDFKVRTDQKSGALTSSLDRHHKLVNLGEVIEYVDQFTYLSDNTAERVKQRATIVDEDSAKSSTLGAMEYVKNGRQGPYFDMTKTIEKLMHSSASVEYMNKMTSTGRTHWDYKHHSDISNSKSATIVANFFKGVPYNVLKAWNCIRKFHPIECERLQGYEDDNTRWGDFGDGCIISYNCNERKCKNYQSCQKVSVKSKTAKIKSMCKKLNSVGNITNNSNVQIRWSTEDLKLTKQKNVKLINVIDTNKLPKVFVSCIIKDGKDEEQLINLRELLKQIINVNIVIARSGYQEHSECVTNITKCGNYTKIRYTWKKNEQIQGIGDTLGIEMDIQHTEEFWNNTLDENYQKMKLSTILTLLNPIIESLIYTYVKTTRSISVSMQNSKDYSKKELNFHVLNLKTDGTIISDTNRYKMIGNGWSNPVIAHIFKHMLV